MPTFHRSTLMTSRGVLAAAALAGAAAFARAYAQLAAVAPVAKAPPQLKSLVHSLSTVTIGRLDRGQTVTQSFTPNPAPAGGVMSVNGDWPVGIVSGGEAQVNRKIRAVLRSPAGQVVADGCGYSRDAKPTAAGSTIKPALSAAGEFQSSAQDANGPWNVAVSYCDGAGAPPSGASRVLGDIKIHVSYRAAR
jgi:hypothetical protein